MSSYYRVIWFYLSNNSILNPLPPFNVYILVSFWLEDSEPSSQPQPEQAEQEQTDRDDDFTNGLLIRDTDYIFDWSGVQIIHLIDQWDTDYIFDWSVGYRLYI